MVWPAAKHVQPSPDMFSDNLSSYQTDHRLRVDWPDFYAYNLPTIFSRRIP